MSWFLRWRKPLIDYSHSGFPWSDAERKEIEAALKTTIPAVVAWLNTPTTFRLRGKP